MSATVQKGIEAVEQADAPVPESKEVQAAAAKSKAEKKSKYTDEVRKATKRAQEIRTKRNAVAPVTVTRVQAVLTQTKTDPEAVVKAFKSQKDAAAYAGGDKEIKTPDLVSELGEKLADPFARGRGMVAICLALAGK
jgi:1,4-dihydroxy-2-naphthoyl-CoA synthase